MEEPFFIHGTFVRGGGVATIIYDLLAYPGGLVAGIYCYGSSLGKSFHYLVVNAVKYCAVVSISRGNFAAQYEVPLVTGYMSCIGKPYFVLSFMEESAFGIGGHEPQKDGNLGIFFLSI